MTRLAVSNTRKQETWRGLHAPKDFWTIQFKREKKEDPHQSAHNDRIIDVGDLHEMQSLCISALTELDLSHSMSQSTPILEIDPSYYSDRRTRASQPRGPHLHAAISAEHLHQDIQICPALSVGGAPGTRCRWLIFTQINSAEHLGDPPFFSPSHYWRLVLFQEKPGRYTASCTRNDRTLTSSERAQKNIINMGCWVL